MNMDKRGVLLFLVIFFVVMFGCTRGPRIEDVEEEYRRGTRGLVMDFLPNAPPDTLYDGDKISVIVELKNEGAYPTSESFNGKLEITGFDESAFQYGAWDGGNIISPDLEGRSQNNPEGGYDTKEYKATVRVPMGGEKYEPTIIVHSCYMYKTIASPMVCIDPEPYEVVQERKVCEIRDVSLGSGQGGPVAVTRVEEQVSTDKIHFRIHVSNVGGGTVIRESAYGYGYNDRCPLNLDFDDLDKVSVLADLAYAGAAECSPSGTSTDPVRLVNGKGVIRCSFDKPKAKSAFTTPLKIELSYAYSSTISKRLKIINLD